MEKDADISRVAIVVKWNHPDAVAIGTSLGKWLESRNVQASLFENAEPGVGGFVGGEVCLPDVGLIVVLGGDGTLLSAVRKNRCEAPILGVNLGGLGFLTEISIGELYPTMERVLTGDFETQARTILNTAVFRKNKQLAEYSVLNDAVINKAALARMIRLHTYVDGLFLNSFRSDGLIVSSPTGSTAYNLSAGGPILYPTLDCVVLTPICPFTLSNRPIILPDSCAIEICIGEKAQDVTLTFDGQVGLDLESGDIVKVMKAKNKVLLVKSPWADYFKILRTKLNWGDEQ